MLYNLQTGAWDDELLGMMNVPPSVLPKVCASSESVRREQSRSARCERSRSPASVETNRRALFGQDLLHARVGQEHLRHRCFMLMNVGSEAVASKHRLLTTVAWKLAAKTEYALEGASSSAAPSCNGFATAWASSHLPPTLRNSPPPSLTLAAFYMVPAFADWARRTGINTPRAPSPASRPRHNLRPLRPRGIGKQRVSSRRHSDIRQKDSAVQIKDLRVDGGASANDLLMQFQADLLRVPVVRPKVTGNNGPWRGISGRPGRRLLERPTGCPRGIGKSSDLDPKMSTDEVKSSPRALDRRLTAFARLGRTFNDRRAKSSLSLPINHMNMQHFIAELIGTAILITVGNGVVATFA